MRKKSKIMYMRKNRHNKSARDFPDAVFSFAARFV